MHPDYFFPLCSQRFFFGKISASGAIVRNDIYCCASGGKKIRRSGLWREIEMFETDVGGESTVAGAASDLNRTLACAWERRGGGGVAFRSISHSLKTFIPPTAPLFSAQRREIHSHGGNRGRRVESEEGGRE